jgi:hypothetical protein
MKKVIGLLLVFVFLVSISGVGFAQVEKKKAELAKVREYMIVLDQKIKKARAAKKINKIAELKDLKRKELARAKKLKAEIARLEKGRPKAKARAKGRARFQAGLGFGGGAGILGVGYAMPLGGLGLLVDGGYGMGSKYSVLSVNLSGIFPFGDNYAGLGMGMANYSETVTDIPGVSGNIDKGSKFGFGLFVGRAFGPLLAQIGYNSALGLTAGVNYKF